MREIIPEDMKKVISKYCRENNVFPKLEHLGKTLGLSNYKVIEMLRVLQDRGFIQRKYNKYSIKRSAVEAVLQEETEKTKKDVVVIVLRILMAIVGIGACVLSVYYTTAFLLDYLNIYLAVLLSSIMIVFSVAAFQFLVIFIQNKQGWIVAIFILMWIIVLVFSMFSTIVGQYNKRIKNEDEKNNEKVSVIHKNMEFEIYNRDEDELVSSIEIKKKEYQTLQNLLDEFDTLKKRKDDYAIFWDTTWRMTVLKEAIAALEAEKKKVRETKLDFLKTQQTTAGAINETKIETASFYVWLSQMLDIPSQYIEFWLSMFPAVFIDIIAPLALAVSIFLRRKKNAR